MADSTSQSTSSEEPDGGAHAFAMEAPPPTPRSGPRLLHRCMHAFCCCRGCCGARCAPLSYTVSAAATNKVLPVSSMPTQCDFLQIRAHRRIRVLHHWAGKLQGPDDPTAANGNGVIPGGAGNDLDESDEEDYWFENAAPRRLQIQQPPPRSQANNRIFNKFEPQEPPRIAGINPPRKSSTASLTSVGSTGSNQDASPGARLPRKIILPHDGMDLDDEDDDLVVVSPRNNQDEEVEDKGNMVTMDEPPEQFNAVAIALESMSGMLLNITADSTTANPKSMSPRPGESNLSSLEDDKKARRRSRSRDRENDREASRSPSPAGMMKASSPKANTKSVQSSPDPEGKSSNDQVQAAADNTTVIVMGGHLGGMANAAFEDEEVDNKAQEEEEEKEERRKPESQFSYEDRTEEEDSQESPDQAADETDRSSTHNADAAYHRERDLDAVVASVLMNQEKSQKEEEEGISDHPLANPHALPAAPASPLRPALFLIHGVGGSASTWATQIAHFTALGYEIVAPDLLGHGFSSVPDNAKCYTFNKLFRDVLAIFDHYIPEGRRCVVIAHSYGCSFAAALARTRPSSVAMLLLLASGGPTPLAPPKVLKSIPSSMLGCLKPFLKCGFLRQQQYNPRGRTLKFQEAFDVPAYVFRHIMNGQYWPEGDASFHRRITVPTLLIYGLKDPFVSLVEMCEMERTIPKAYLELAPLAGHMIMLDQPKELNAMMRRFIEKYSLSANGSQQR